MKQVAQFQDHVWLHLETKEDALADQEQVGPGACSAYRFWGLTEGCRGNFYVLRNPAEQTVLVAALYGHTAETKIPRAGNEAVEFYMEATKELAQAVGFDAEYMSVIGTTDNNRHVRGRECTYEELGRVIGEIEADEPGL